MLGKKLKSFKNLFSKANFVKTLPFLIILLVIITGFYSFQKKIQAQIVVDNAYHSYNTQIQNATTQAKVTGTASGQDANLEINMSAGDNNLVKGSPFDKYVAGVHPEGFNNLAPYWTTNNPYGDYPYVGKSTVDRGDGETGAPAPLGVRDLQVHPPSTDQYLLVAFVVPTNGTYRVKDLGVRDVLPWGTTATMRTYSPTGSLLSTLTTNGQAWINDNNEYLLQNVTAGSKIIFAISRDGDYVGDATKINWTVEKVTIVPDGNLVVSTTIPGLNLIIDGQAQTAPYNIPTTGPSTVALYAPSIQTTTDGKTVRFLSWSDGGAQSHTVARNITQTITATYEEVAETPVFSNGFEEGNTSAYPQGNIDIVQGNTLQVKTTKPRTGNYSLEVASDGSGPVTQAVIDAIPAKSNTIYINTNISLDATTALGPGQFLNPIAIKNENYRRLFYLSIDSDYKLHPILFNPADEGYCEPDICGKGTHLPSVGPALPRDGSWHNVQLRYTVSANHGQVEVWLDGVRVGNFFELNTGTAGVDDVNVVTWGTFFSSLHIQSKAYFDDLAISHTFVPNQVPGGFQNEDFAGDLDFPTYALPLPDGRVLIGQKNGIIKVWQNGAVLATPLITIPNVNTFQDRGLISMAIDPNFATNHYLYVAYTYDVNPSDFEGPKTARVVRYTMNGNTAPLSSQIIILGSVGGTAANPSCNGQPVGADCMPSDGRTHTVGDMHFLPDGTLMISAGEGASDLNVNDNAMRAQNLDSLGGKFLRVTATGQGLADNPFYNGNVNANRSKVWAYGFRNPFRFGIKPGTSTPFVGDVGWGAWEEINVVQKGKNYGWPCYEGLEYSPGYGPVYPVCQTLQAAGTQTAPLYTYPHPPGSAVVGGLFYTGSVYPSEYQGSYFFGDYAQSKIWTLKVNAANELQGQVTEVPIEPDGPVQFFTGANGDIYYISIYTGQIRRLNFSTAGLAPVVAADATPKTGALPLNVAFSSAGTTDPDGNTSALTYRWDFGDGQTSIEANPTHTYTVKGKYTATLTVTDVQGNQASKSVVVSPGNSAPVVTITTPASTYQYTVGDTVNFAASATDAEDGTLATGAFTWDITLKHCEVVTNTCHNHPFLNGTGNTGSFTAPDHGDGTSLILKMTAKDSDNTETSQTLEILPKKVAVTFTSNRTGATFVLNGVTHATPITLDVQANADNSLTTNSPQTVSGVSYVFDNWSDGGAQSRILNTTIVKTVDLRLKPETTPTTLPKFESQNVEIKDGNPQLEVKDGTASASLEISVSGGDNNLVPGLPFSKFYSTPHPEGFNNLAPYYTTDNPFGHYPYVGKSTVDRGDGDPTAPAPLNARDLQVHPPSTNQYLLLSFIVPQNGDYKVSNIGIKDILPWGATVSFKLFNGSGQQLSNVTSNGQLWVTDSNSYTLTGLTAGQKIQFAVSSDGDYVGDAAKITWKIEKTN